VCINVGNLKKSQQYASLIVLPTVRYKQGLINIGIIHSVI